MAREHKHRFRRAPGLANLGGMRIERCQCGAQRLTPLRRIAGAAGPLPDPAAPLPLPKPGPGWLGRNVSIVIGYVDDQGMNTTATMTPPAGLNRQQLARRALQDWQGLGRPAPVWIDGQPGTLVADVAALLGIPVGWPDGWLPPDPGVAGG